MPESAIFDHYEVLKREDGSLFELGRGAMGITYKAFDTSLRIHVALKVISGAYLNSEVARQRFVREARSAAKLRHRHVASVFHLGIEGDTYFYAMEFIDGETVDALIRRQGALEPLFALRIAEQVARALGEAQKHGLVHRDIKPANLMLVQEDDEVCVKVIDFGLAKSSRPEGEDAATLSMGGFVGTPYFASPEQLEERETDARSDIYSLGVTLWYMLAGRTPFSGSLALVMSQHLSKPPPLDHLSGLPNPVVSLLDRMLQKDPEQRQQTPQELRKELEDCIRTVSEPAVQEETPGVETAAAPEHPAAAPEAPAIRNAKKGSPFLIALGVLAAFGAIAAGIGLWTHAANNPAPVAKENRPEAALTSMPSPSAALAAESAPPAPAIQATPMPSATPVPTPSQKQLLVKRLADAEGFEADQNWPACIKAYVQIAKDFPESETGKTRLGLVLEKFLESPETLDGVKFDAARDSLTDAAHLDVTPAMMILGAHLQKEDAVAGFNWYYAAADRGDVAAMTHVGLMYAKGLGVDADYGKAFEWFQKASDKGDTMGKFCLGECFLRGKGTPMDQPKGVALLKEAADAKEPRAMDLLGTCYDHGWGTEKNVQEAFRLYSGAVDLHYWDALANLAVLYINGDGVPKDRRKAADLFLQGSKNGSALCMFQYARCVQSGTGVPSANKDSAILWFRKAAEAGYAPAMEWCVKNNIPLQGAPAP